MGTSWPGLSNKPQDGEGSFVPANTRFEIAIATMLADPVALRVAANAKANAMRMVDAIARARVRWRWSRWQWQLHHGDFVRGRCRRPPASGCAWSARGPDFVLSESKVTRPS